MKTLDWRERWRAAGIGRRAGCTRCALHPPRQRIRVSSAAVSARTFTGIALWRGIPEIGSKSRSVVTSRLVALPMARTRPSSSGTSPRACAIEITPGSTSVDASAIP